MFGKPKRNCSLTCVFFWLLGFLVLLSTAPWFLACTISPLSKELDTRWGIHSSPRKLVQLLGYSNIGSTTDEQS